MLVSIAIFLVCVLASRCVRQRSFIISACAGRIRAAKHRFAQVLRCWLGGCSDHFAARRTMRKLVALLFFVFFCCADCAALMDDSVRLRARAESTDDILQVLAGDAAQTFGSSGGSAADRAYAEDRRRMLDAESVAIKHILREAFAVFGPGQRAAI